MISSITLHNVIPQIFISQPIESDIWGKDIHFSAGESYLIEAASGRGKSSLLSYIYGYRHDYSGDILIDNKNILLLTQNDKQLMRRQELSVLYQDLRLFDNLTAYENVDIKNQLTHFYSQDTIKQLFERLGIADKQAVQVRQLSFGQQQRVALIRALCQPMSFLLLDEPISHIDDNNAHIMAQIIAEQQSKYGFGIITTSIGKQLPINYTRILHL